MKNNFSLKNKIHHAFSILCLLILFLSLMMIGISDYSKGAVINGILDNPSLRQITRDYTGNIHVVYIYGNTLYYAKSTDNGYTWSKKAITPTNCPQTPSIATYGNRIYIAYSDRVSNDGYSHYDIYFTKSVDGGISWSSPKRVNPNDNWWYWNPQICAYDNEIYIAWYCWDWHEIYFKKSTDGGKTWNTWKNWGASKHDADESFSFANRGNELYIVYSTQNDYKLNFVKSMNGGNSWTTPVNIISGGYNPSLAVGDSGWGTLYLTFQHGGMSYFKSSVDDGNTWGVTKLISNSGSYPSVSGGYRRAFIFWQSSNKIFLKVWNADKNELSVSEEIAAEGTSFYSSVMNDKKNIIDLIYYAGNWKIYHKKFNVDYFPSPPPTLYSPSNGETTSDNTPTFRWYSVSGATKYQIQVDDYSGFYSPAINKEVTSPYYTPSSSLSDGTYYWRVRAYKNGWGDWSDEWSFTISSIPPPTL
ncbi:MAG TPA: hypothetical protein ENI52_00700, partial [Thermoplasmata archaeon]|nr:hypothetical protein [Thermoplasmata archaeon]